ncbi:MAG: TetR/AcrR family transcriptional regulator [Pseudomonadales bacterium]|nr:TetR/AcrR family transcriptional regulator [Pseudomonadales bacterium]
MANQQQNNRKARSDTPEYAEVKQRMVDAAIELISETGFNKFRFEELAEKIGCNRATLYRYFDSKQDLITAVMLTLMHEITNDIIEKTAGSQTVTAKTFTDALYDIIRDLRTDKRYAIVMDAQNVETFARLTHEYFSAITTSMLEKHMTDTSSGRVLKAGVSISDAVHWLMHQIISYGFFGVKGVNEQQQKAYLEKMVVSVII